MNGAPEGKTVVARQVGGADGDMRAFERALPAAPAVIVGGPSSGWRGLRDQFTDDSLLSRRFNRIRCCAGFQKPCYAISSAAFQMSDKAERSVRPDEERRVRDRVCKSDIGERSQRPERSVEVIGPVSGRPAGAQA